ncbi:MULTISPECIES: tail fiber assembly protein [unclassified Pseudomonas]|uniref:tail fiber assembly protein n=1 Tax=unclassified Pseudomonas TaxID=196821 RepID=UPI001F58260F|nr:MULTISPECIES: tail fiber assembly protein [unclassified Pseudomonas]
MTKFYIVFNDDGTLSARLPMNADVADPLPKNIASVSEELWLKTMQENDGVWTRDAKGEIKKYPFPPPSSQENLAANTDRQEALLKSASQAMTPLLMSLQLGDATDEETASAKAWQGYCRALKAVDLLAQSPSWPDKPDV